MASRPQSPQNSLITLAPGGNHTMIPPPPTIGDVFGLLEDVSKEEWTFDKTKFIAQQVIELGKKRCLIMVINCLQKHSTHSQTPQPLSSYLSTLGSRSSRPP